MVKRGSRFRVDGGALIWRSWDEDEYVVYHRMSGETHLLNPVAAAVVRALERAALSVDELSDRIAAEFECGAPSEYRPGLVDLLDHLDALGLIRPAPPR